MSQIENLAAFEGYVSSLAADDQREINLNTRKALLIQSAIIGPEEYVRIAGKLGAEVRDIIIQFPQQPIEHYAWLPKPA